MRIDSRSVQKANLVASNIQQVAIEQVLLLNCPAIDIGTVGAAQVFDDDGAVDDAENPLQLLARASYFQPAEEPRKKDTPPQLPTVAVHQRPHLRPPEKSRVNDVQRFFSSAKANLDVGDDIDPISLGLVTMEEADTLFSL